MGTGGMTWSARVCRRLGHPSTCTGGTDPAALARKRYQKAMAATCALCPRKPKAEQPTGQKPTELFFNMMPDRPAALVVLGKPALQVPCDDLIERRSLRPPTGITLLWRLSPRGGCCPLGWTLATGRDHGDTRLSEVPHSESGCRGHEGQRAVAVTGTRMA
jgi:hypothetical protein